MIAHGISHHLHRAEVLRRRQNISRRGILFSASSSDKKKSSSFFSKSLSCSILLSKACCLPMRQVWQHPWGQSEHHRRVDLSGTAAGSNVYSAIWEASFSFLFFSLRLLLLHQEDDLKALYLFSIFCICRLSDVKLARRSVTSST